MSKLLRWLKAALTLDPDLRACYRAARESEDEAWKQWMFEFIAKVLKDPTQAFVMVEAIQGSSRFTLADLWFVWLAGAGVLPYASLQKPSFAGMERKTAIWKKKLAVVDEIKEALQKAATPDEFEKVASGLPPEQRVLVHLLNAYKYTRDKADLEAARRAAKDCSGPFRKMLSFLAIYLQRLKMAKGKT